MTYTVYIAGILNSIHNTLEDAENRVAEIISKYEFVNPDNVYIVG